MNTLNYCVILLIVSSFCSCSEKPIVPNPEVEPFALVRGSYSGRLLIVDQNMHETEISVNSSRLKKSSSDKIAFTNEFGGQTSIILNFTNPRIIDGNVVLDIDRQIMYEETADPSNLNFVEGDGGVFLNSQAFDAVWFKETDSLLISVKHQTEFLGSLMPEKDYDWSMKRN